MLWTADATALADLDRCEQFFVYRHVENLAEVEESAALTQGKEVHAVLARWWRGEVIESAPPWLDDYAKQRAEVRNANTVLLVEEPLVVGDYGGVPDLVLWGERDIALVVDHKTTAKPLTAAWVEQWALSEQFAGYLDLVEATLPKKGITFSDIKVVVDALQMKNGQLVGTGWYEFAVPLGLRKELRNTRGLKIDQAWELKRDRLPLKRTGSCYAWGRACPYLPLCRLGTPEHRAAMRDILVESGTLEAREWNFANRGV